MGAPSSEQEAKEVAAELDRMPRTRAVADRLQVLIDDGSTTRDQRDRYVALLIAVDYDIKVRHELTEGEFREWQACVPGLVDPVTKDAVPA